jgi:hypothetical protein
MDDRTPSIQERCEQIGSDTMPIVANIQNSVELAHEFAISRRDPIESSMVVYCGTDQQVDANFSPAGTALATDNPEQGGQINA